MNTLINKVIISLLKIIKLFCPYRQKSWNGKIFDACNKNNNGYGSNADPCIVKAECASYLDNFEEIIIGEINENENR